jgi:uncharacterized protein (TIGR01732 family)
MKTGIQCTVQTIAVLKEEKTMGSSQGNAFALIVVLFILLIIVGAAFVCC